MVKKKTSNRLEPRLRKPIPFDFVLNELADLEPLTRPMFGCTAVYLREKIVLILRDKQNHLADNGVWLATTAEHHKDLKIEFPSMRSIALLGNAPTAWQVLPSESLDFENAALRACELIREGDPRIGTVPKARSRKKTKTEKKSKIAR